MTALYALQLILPVAFLIFLQQVRFTQHVCMQTGEDLQMLVFTKADFSKLQINEEGEFIFHSMLYDAHSIRQQNGKYFVYALADKDEMRLMSANAKNENTSERSIISKNGLFSFLFWEQSAKLSFENKFNCETCLLFRANQFLSAPFLEIITPPPNRA